MSRVGRERGWPPPHAGAVRSGAGSARSSHGRHARRGDRKILAQHEVFSHQRYLMQMAVGAQPQAAILRSIELLGTIVAPAVRAALAKRKVPA